MNLGAAKLLFEILKLGAEVFGIVEDKRLARRTAERDAEVARLKAELAVVEREIAMLKSERKS